MRNLWPAIALTLVIVVLTCIIYPLLVTGLAQTLFPVQANGSLIDKNGQPTTDTSKAVGSSLIGQWFDQPQYFWPRPSGHQCYKFQPKCRPALQRGPIER